MAGSQLKRLKATLKANGLIGQTNVKNSKNTKRPSDKNRKDKERIIQNIREQFNPFEVKKTHQKFADIGGRKVIGAVGKPGLSKQIGEESRRAALMEEKRLKNRTGGILDRRFGENDPTMNPEDKMLERFTRERQSRASKQSLFNLDDDNDNDNEYLTHYGQSLSLKDDFDAGDLGISDDENNEMLKRRRALTEGEEGGFQGDFEGQPDKKKTKAEVMKEVIAKSKFHKAERQNAKEEDLNIIDAMNDSANFNELLSELRGSGEFGAPVRPVMAEKNKEYDTQVRELGFDRKAKPTDRTKTDEEIAKAEAEKLKELEEQRLRRMRGEEEEEDTRAPEADDLADDFDDAREFGISKAKYEKEDAELLEESEEEQESEAEEEGSEKSHKKKTTNVAFTYPCPSSHEEFVNMLEPHKIDKHATIIDRIVVLHHPSLMAGNKEKLGVFCNILLDHILYLADHENAGEYEDVVAKCDEQMRLLIKVHTESFSEYCRDKLAAFREEFEESLESSEEVFPLPSHLMFFTLIGTIFSTSDNFHIIATPAMLLMAEYLTMAKTETIESVLGGLYICELFMRYQRISKRYVPEVTSYLARILNEFIVSNSDSTYILKNIHSTKARKFDFKINKKHLSKKQDIKLRLSDINPYNETKSVTMEKLNLVTLSKSVDLVSKYASLWSDKIAFVEIFDCFEEMSEAGKDLINKLSNGKETIEKITRLIKFCKQDKQPLSLQSHRPLAIATFMPKFEENYNVDKKSYDPDQQRQEIGKLKAEIKNERKSAIREIRKDTAFNAREKLREDKDKYDAYHEKMAKLVRTVQTEEGAEKNQYEREKVLRKRSKK